MVSDESAGVIHPTWSPDGRYVAYTKIPVKSRTTFSSPPAGDIWAINLSTGATFRLTTTACLDTDPCWGLDGWIYFSSTRTTGRFNLLSGKIAPNLFDAVLAEKPIGPPEGKSK